MRFLVPLTPSDVCPPPGRLSGLRYGEAEGLASSGGLDRHNHRTMRMVIPARTVRALIRNKTEGWKTPYGSAHILRPPIRDDGPAVIMENDVQESNQVHGRRRNLR